MTTAEHPSGPAEAGRDIDMRPFSQSLPMALLRARESTMRFFRPTLSRHDLTEQQWRVLRALASATTPLEVGEIAERTFLLAPSLSRILTRLESRQLVGRAAVPADQRRSTISLTADGLDLVRQIAPLSEARYEDIERRFGPERLRQLLGLLDDLADIDADAEADAEADPAASAP